MTKEQEIMQFLHERVFDPVLNSPTASYELKQGVRLTILRMKDRDAYGMVHYFWSAISGTEKSIRFAWLMREEGFDRFEEAIDEFRERFSDLCHVEKMLNIATSRNIGQTVWIGSENHRSTSAY